jgi:hydroxyacylglutathione hydrolase
MRLSREVYLVGGGDLGFNLSHASDSHMYVIRDGDDLAMIDVGLGLDIDRVVTTMKDDGLDPEAISKIFVTHYHADHAGGLSRWSGALNATVHASRDSASAIRAGDAGRVGLIAAQRAGIYPADYVLEPCPVGIELHDGETFSIGDSTLTAVDSPGHCDGHMVFDLRTRDRGYLFSGDCLLWGGTIILQNIPDCDIAAYAATIERLSGLSLDALLPGHMGISLANGHRHVDKALESFRRLRLPSQALPA